MSRPVSSSLELVRPAIRGPRDLLPPPSRTAPPSMSEVGWRQEETCAKQIPVDRFHDVLKYSGYYAELYPDILPLTRRLHRQLLEQIAANGPELGIPVAAGAGGKVPTALARTADGWYTAGDLEAGEAKDSEMLDVRTMLTPSPSTASSGSSYSDGRATGPEIGARGFKGTGDLTLTVALGPDMNVEKEEIGLPCTFGPPGSREECGPPFALDLAERGEACSTHS